METCTAILCHLVTFVLIVPCGMETRLKLNKDNRPARVLIVPCGMETSVYLHIGFYTIVLIVPCGMETTHTTYG